jgi:hypothetical protein
MIQFKGLDISSSRRLPMTLDKRLVICCFARGCGWSNRENRCWAARKVISEVVST